MGGYYYVIDTKSKRVIQFNESGENIALFDKHGPGPEEYLQMLDVRINFQSEKIEILEYRKIQVYSLNILTI
ncbi:6-bladed beta-propeller [Anditalea andensis]|uniref:6-bladed beta-propeller n=1 Tax=Anditalea andensis TaxID=1048983 RepID=A0A074KY44_9BACT|nr:hypothetical protein EL17_17455 [Anditalea andensis]